MTEEYTTLLLRIYPFNEAQQLYPVEAELDDGSRFAGGQFKLNRQELLALQLEVEGFGSKLFEALFAQEIRRAYDKATGRAEARSEGRLRIKLWVDADAVELHALPWERLYHPHRGHNIPLTTSTLTPFSRYTSLETLEPPPVNLRPLKMLIAIANPTNLPGGLAPANVEVEVESLRQALGDLVKSKQMQVTIMPGHTGLSPELRARLEAEGYKLADGPTTLDNLIRQLSTTHIFHFIGHGSFRRQGERGAGQTALHLENDDGLWKAARDEEIVARLAAVGTLPHLAFFVACESAKRDENAEHPFIGLGPQLVRAGVPAVVAMQEQVPVELARLLSGEFYRRLTEHGMVDKALNQARLAVFKSDGTEWAIPVLFSRLQSGQIFTPSLITDTDGATPGTSPFKGLQYFDERDAGLFFGREKLTVRLVYRLHRAISPAPGDQQIEGRFLAVIGASGSGKSSVVRAGLISALRKGEHVSEDLTPPEGSTHWPIHIFTPTLHPLEALATRLTHDEESVTATTTLIEDMKRDPRSLHLYIRKKLSRIKTDDGSEVNGLLLGIDQFEEIFTLCKDETERAAFVNNLMEAALAGGPTLIVITLRADFYDECAKFSKLRELLSRRQEYIGPMASDELRRAIEEPAKRGNWNLESGLVDLLLREAGEEPGALPLLSHALLETWKRREGRTLTVKGYTDSGGVRGAIAKTAETVYRQMEGAQQAVARRIFLRLIEVAEGTQATRRRASRDELIPRPEDAPMVDGMLKTLSDARLIAVGDVTVEIAHEALIREWPTLKEWIERNREGLRIQRELGRAVKDWVDLERDAGGLYRGLRLIQAMEWAEENAADINPLEQEFIKASRDAVKKEEDDKEARRQRELKATRRLAEQARELAETERRLAEEKARASQKQLETAQQLAESERKKSLELEEAKQRELEAAQQLAEAERQRAREAEEAKQRDLEAAQQLAEAERETAREVTAAHNRELEAARKLAETRARSMAQQRRLSVIFGALAVVAGLAFIVAVWQIFVAQRSSQEALAQGNLAATAQAANTQVVAQQATSVANADAAATAQVVAKEQQSRAEAASTQIASQAGTTRARELSAFALNSLDTDPELSILLALEGVNVTYRTDHQVLPEAETALQRAVQLSRLVQTLTSDQIGIQTVRDLAFSPDGKRFAMAGDNRTVKIWDIEGKRVVLTLPGHTGFIRTVVFNQNGTLLATGSADETTRIWDANTGRVIVVLPKQSDVVNSVVFSPDDRRLAVGTADGNPRVWDLASGREVLRLNGHTASINSIAYSPDGKRIATGSSDGNVKVWNADTGQILLTLQNHSVVNSVAFSADGLYLISGNNDNNATLYEAASGRLILTLFGHKDSVLSADFSADGTRIVTSSADGKAKVWNRESGQELYTLSGHTDQVLDGLFSPDGKFILTASNDHTVRFWDASTGREYIALSPEGDAIWDIAFSPKDDLLATANFGGEVTVYSLQPNGQAEKTATLQGHTREVWTVAFSPDGTRLVTASADKTARVWEVNTGQSLFTLTGHSEGVVEGSEGVLSAVYSSDGKLIATAGADGTAEIWNAETGAPEAILTGHADGVTNVSFSPDNQRLATASADSTIKIWDISKRPTEELLTLTGHSGIVWDVSYSPDGTRLISAGSDRTVRIWDAQTGELKSTFTGHTSVVYSAEYSPNQQWFTTAGADGTVQVWNTETSQQILNILNSNSVATSARFTPAGRQLATASVDGQVRFFLLDIDQLLTFAKARLTRWFTTDECVQYLRQTQCPPAP